MKAFLNGKLNKQSGAAILMAILILVAILSIAFGVTGLLYGEIKLSQETPKSLKAYYAAETGIERKLYDIRKNSDFSDIGNPADLSNCAYGTSGVICLESTDDCYSVDVTTGDPTIIKAYGCYKDTKRAIEASY